MREPPARFQHDPGAALTWAEAVRTRIGNLFERIEAEYEESLAGLFLRVSQEHPKMTGIQVKHVCFNERAQEGSAVHIAHRRLLRASALKRAAEDRYQERKRRYFDSRGFGRGG